MKVSIIIPVYNEEKTITQIVKRVKALPFEKEIIVVDDGSTDSTREKLKKIKGINTYFHRQNQGKGAAIKTGLKKATGGIIITQDADLEYSPEELPKLIEPIKNGEVEVVYGSRFISQKHPFSLFYFGNRFLTHLTSILFLTKISDMETGYKVFKAEVIKPMKIHSNRFDFEPEVTAKILKNKVKLLEIPISYQSRSFKEGKKLTWRDGVVALYKLIRFRFFD